MRDVVDQGLRDIYAVAPPFVPKTHSELHALVILTACAFCLAIAVTAGSRPFLAAAVAAGGIGWPATILPARNTIAMGALALLAALWPIVISGLRDRRGLVPGAAVSLGIVLVAVVLAGAGARPSVAALDWQNWDLFGESRAGHTVVAVWRSDYGGIDFPPGKTTVLKIKAPRRALYWRATTLDTFASDHWVETLYPTAADRRTGRCHGIRCSPRPLVARRLGEAGGGRAGARRRPRHRCEPADGDRAGRRHGHPLSERRRHDDARAASPTCAATPSGAMRRTRHRRRSSARLPRIRARSARYLDVGRTVVPAYGAPGRAAAVSGIFQDDLYQQLWAYEPMWREASRLTAKARSPYEATITIERWLRSSGGFGYDEHPPASAGAPPLVDFLERSKLGYCQQFAGTMALMLRYLGIPARVAVGFTSGTWKDGTWTVTDHDAHAWVEAWFAGHGWLTFDPTPGRGTLSATYTNASDSADAIRALGTGRFLGAGSFAPTTPRRGVATPEETTSAGIPWRLIVPLALIAAALLGLALVKSGARWRRARTRRPAAPRIGGAGRAGGLHSRPGLAGAAVGLDPSALARAARPWGRNRRVRRRLRACPLRAAGERRGGRGRDAPGAARILSLLRDAARAGEEDPWLSHGALAPQRLTHQAR